MVGQGLPLLAFWFIITLLAGSSVFSGGGVTCTEGAVQDVSLVIEYSLNSYKPQSAYCFTGDIHQSLTSTVLSSTHKNFHTDNTGTYQKVGWNDLSDVLGVTCSLGGKEAVAGPIIHQATVTPRRLSVTLNKGEDLHLPLNTHMGYTSRQVLWQKEPWQNSAWNKATLTNSNELYIPSNELQGSGIYLVIPEPAITHSTQWPDQYDVFHLVVRECPAQRCGSHCIEWCPDCLNGGVCDAKSCECVCPAGVMGHRCQTLCQDGFIGRNCTVLVGNFPIREMVCVSAPLGCTCAPGYYGEYCNTKCPGYMWGVDCAQPCRNCRDSCYNSGRCNYKTSCSRWGHCQGTQKRFCGEGDLGLPRLRQPPRVTSTSESATVSFNAWQQNYDDGEMPSSGTLDSYLLQYWQQGHTRRSQKSVAPQTSSTIVTTQLTDLEPGTTYNLKVLVKVKVAHESCNAGRWRVNTFNTICPNPPKPERLSVSAVNYLHDVYPYSLDASWQAVSYLHKCDLQYELWVTSTASGRHIKTFNPTGTSKRLTDLEANTEYIVSLRTCYKNTRQCSVPNSTTKRTRPGEPGQVGNLLVVPSDTSIFVTWDKPADYPPRGQLESFRVTWSVAGQTSTHKEKVLQASSTAFLIQDLQHNTGYEIMVEAKNKDVAKYGPAATTTTTTTLGVPSEVKRLVAKATKSSLTLTWQPPATSTGVTTWYNVSLHQVNNNAFKRDISANETHAKLEDLSVGQEYLANVAACNKQRCGAVMKLSCWTRPDLPLLQGSVDLMAASDTTITILLPRLTNPPGLHWITVKNEGRQSRTLDWKENLKDDAKALVYEEIKARYHRKAKREVTDEPELYIACKVHQEGDEELEVTLGDNMIYEQQYHNRPLKKDAAYWVVVVTEKWSGPYVERVISVPQRFVAAPIVSSLAWLWGILGVVAVAMVAAAVLVMYFRKRRNRLVAQQQNANTVDVPEGEPWPEEHPLPMMEISSQHQGDFVDEDIYANARLEITESDLEAYLLRAVMSRETRIEFDNVPSFLSSAYSESDLPENRSKNRYRNKVTYDDTRVILPLYNNIPYSDYINANYVEGPTRPAAFIAAQGPKEETVGAFWRMMWHTNCRVIVMVANLLEGKKVKVAQYWPERQPLITEGITVTPIGVTVKMDFVKRTFTMSVGNTQKEVSQYQYTGWPDHGVPKMPYGLAQMIKLIRKNCGHREQLTVHCSAGIGRTGTVILVMYLLDQLQARGAVNPSEALMVLRRGRGRLVENTEQYIFAHQVLHEVLFGLETCFLCHSFEDQLPVLYSSQSPDGVSPLHRQYQKLKNMPKDLSFKHGKNPACAHLNRNQDILPADSSMVFVQGKSYGPDAQYLNVIIFNGIDQKNAYLAGEHPQRHTLGKMWRLVYQRKVAVWVLVHTFPDHDPEFPDVVRKSSALDDKMTLKVSSTHTFQNYDEREVDIYVTEMGKVIKHRCLLISLRGWPAAYCLPASPEPLLSVIEKAEAFSSQEHPPLFTCKDGVTGCGVVAALMLAVSRAKLIQEVDIYRSVASVQQSRPEFIVNLEQYEFLHTAMAAFLSSNSHYGNFN